MTTETWYEQTNMKIQTFIYDLNSFLAVCYLGTLNSKTRRPTEIICSTNDQCTCMRAMPFIYRSHQGPVPKGHLDWKWLNKMKLKSSSWPMYMEEICIIYMHTEILSARLLIILSMARWISTRLPNTILPNPILPTFVKNDKIS